MIIGKSLTALGCGGLKPEIRVTAKAGALLNLHYKDSTIILQSYQLGAEETQHTFVVSVSETAYVAEDVTNGASVEVLVDVVAQYSVEIKYKLWLYRDGDECEDITGGWSGVNLYIEDYGTTSSQYGSYTKLSDRLKIYSNSDHKSSGFGTAKKIDVTKFTNLKIEVASVVVSASARNAFCINAGGLAMSLISSFIQSTGTNSLDISSYTGDYHITIGAWGNYYDLQVTNVWLE